MEIGMGIHGEAGIKREERKSADEVTEDMMRLLFEDLPLEKRNEVSVLVNSLGATPLEELYIIFRKVSQILQGKNIKIYKPFIGRYATSLEMAGFSITLFKLNEKYKEYLDHPVWTPFVKEG
jgi:dihydroxyacetone kinase-like protein